MTAWFVPTPFRFCLRCGVAYAPTVRSDIGKMSTLGFEGRSTATTMLSLWPSCGSWRPHGHDVPRKLLDFTDNRQDATLQAGHFNDFVQVSLLRSALYRAAVAAGDGRDSTTRSSRPAVIEALGLPLGEYAQNPEAKYGAEGGDRPGLPRGALLPALRRPAGRVAGHLAQPRTGGTATGRLRLPRRAVRGRGRVGRLPRGSGRRRIPAVRAELAPGHARLAPPRTGHQGRPA